MAESNAQCDKLQNLLTLDGDLPEARPASPAEGVRGGWAKAAQSLPSGSLEKPNTPLNVDGGRRRTGGLGGKTIQTRIVMKAIEVPLDDPLIWKVMPPLTLQPFDNDGSGIDREVK